MAATLQEVRIRLRQRYSNLAGEDGEAWAEAWLRAQGWDFQPIDQRIGTKSKELSAAGAKRADFVSVGDKAILFLDAKHHATDGVTKFVLTIKELRAYSCLKALSCAWFPEKVTEVFLMLFPKEDFGKRLIFVDIEEFYLNGVPSQLPDGPALELDIRDRLSDPALAYQL